MKVRPHGSMNAAELYGNSLLPSNEAGLAEAVPGGGSYLALRRFWGVMLSLMILLRTLGDVIGGDGI